MAPARKVKVHCIPCNLETNHQTLQEHTVQETVEATGATYTRKHSIIRCMGCDNVGFMTESWSPGRHDVELLPKASKRELFLSLILGGPEVVTNIYMETVSAFSADAPLLTAVGLRAIVEAVCLDQGCTGQNLQEKIDDLVTKGAIAKAQADFLHLHRLLGNEAVHEMQAASPAELNAAFAIVETVLKNLYELPEIAQGLKDARDKRRNPGP
jgi:Domain of unknown function (DUF4145)